MQGCLLASTAFLEMKPVFKPLIKSRIKHDNYYLTYLVSSKSQTRSQIYDDDEVKYLLPVIKKLGGQLWIYKMQTGNSVLVAMPIEWEGSMLKTSKMTLW
jgi:hypothetical protein